MSYMHTRNIMLLQPMTLTTDRWFTLLNFQERHISHACKQGSCKIDCRDGEGVSGQPIQLV